MNIVEKIIGNGLKISTRDELDIHIREISSLEGITGKWTLKEKAWIKIMDIFKLYRGEVRPFDNSNPPASSAETTTNSSI